MIKNNNILIKFFLIFFFILLIYIIYKSEVVWLGTQRDYYLKYFIGCIIFLIIFFFLFFISNKNKNVIIVLISIIIGLYSFESYLTFKKFRLKANKIFFDDTTPLELYKNLKKKDDYTLVTYLLNHQLTEYNNFFYFSGISNKKTIHCNEGSGVSIYQSDRYGFNNRDEKWNDNTNIEYLLVGDSFTHGSCVNRPYDISSKINFYSKKNVLNLGYSGSGPLIQYAILREYLSPGVKKVLWIYFEGNDLIDLKLELKNKVLNLYLNDKLFSQNLRFKQSLIDNYNQNIIDNTIKKIEVKSNYIDFIKFHKLRSLLFSLSPNQPLEILPQFRLILKQANDLVVNNNSEFFFIYLPDRARFESLKFQDNKEKIKKIVNELNINFVDIDQDIFKKELVPLKLFSFSFGHYNKLGYQKVSKKIYEKTK